MAREIPPKIRLHRLPEPEDHRNMVFKACGQLQTQISCEIHDSWLIEWADRLQCFPKHNRDEFLVELGSESSERRWWYYLRLHVFLVDQFGHCGIHVRTNNNEPLPNRVIAEFCLDSEPAGINRLGKLLREFAAPKYSLLDWWGSDGRVYVDAKEAPGMP